MSPTPAAEVAIDAELVDRLVRTQHPDLVGDVRIVANGWDNVVARLGDAHVVRLPRRAAAAPLVEHEARWLPELAEHVPVPMPAAIRVGRPDADYPWTWLVLPWLEGIPLTDVAVADRARVAADLGAAHAALHRPAPDDAPRNPFRGVPLAARGAVAEQRIASTAPRDAEELAAHFRRAVDATEHTGPAMWLHGDSHPGNLLADAAGPDARLAGIIDFGDLAAGDPASDLAVAWLAFDAEGRAAYRAALGAAGSPVDDAAWRRAHGWAILLAGAFLSADDDPRMSAIGRHAVEQALADPPA